MLIFQITHSLLSYKRLSTKSSCKVHVPFIGIMFPIINFSEQFINATLSASDGF